MIFLVSGTTGNLMYGISMNSESTSTVITPHVGLSCGGVSIKNPKLANITLDDLFAALKFVQEGAKDGPYIVRSAFIEGATTRSDNTLERTSSVIILDADSTEGKIDMAGAPCPYKVHRNLKTAGFNHIIVRSYSDKLQGYGNRYRIFIPTDKPYTKSELAFINNYAIRLCGEPITNVGENNVWSQPWYLPRKPSGDANMFAFLEYTEGHLLSVQPPIQPPKPSNKEAKSIVQTTPEEVRSALRFIDPDCNYPYWSKVISACKLQGEEYCEVVVQWSSIGKKFKGKRDVVRVWNSFEADINKINKIGKVPVTVLSIFKDATKNGWVRDANRIFGKKTTSMELLDCPDIGLEKCSQSLGSLRAHSLSKLTADHFVDAKTILSNTFDNRLVNLCGIPYYFNGEILERASDRLLRRCIGSAMSGGDIKVTQNRIAGTLSVIKDQALEIGGPDPANRNIFFRDCVLNADTGESSHHKIGNRNTSTLSVKYERDADCPKFSEFLHTIFSNDIGQIQLLQELIGWVLCRDNLGIEKAALFIGPPRAGKGVLARLIFDLLGSGAVPFRLSDLDDNKRLSGMRQAKVAIDTDAVGASSRNARAVIGLFKIITSNEKLSIPQLYTQTPWEGALNCKMFVLANSVPTMWDDSAATANRWVPVVFSKTFLGKENPNLYKQLLPELPGITVWAFEGLRRLIARGYFELPPNSQDQLDSLITEGGSTQEFINECLVLGGNHRSSNNALWNTYHGWAVRSGRETNKRCYLLKSLEDALRSNGVRRAKSIKLSDGKFHRGFYGVDVKPEATSKNIISFPPMC